MERAYRVGVRPGRSEKGGKMLPSGHKAVRVGADAPQSKKASREGGRLLWGAELCHFRTR